MIIGKGEGDCSVVELVLYNLALANSFNQEGSGEGGEGEVGVWGGDDWFRLFFRAGRRRSYERTGINVFENAVLLARALDESGDRGHRSVPAFCFTIGARFFADLQFWMENPEWIDNE